MKYTMKTVAWLLAASAILTLGGCGHVLHNGTEMDIAEVKLTGLPADPYAGVTMVFT